MDENQHQQSRFHFIADENHLVMEGISEITLNTPVEELIVLCQTIVDFKNLKDNDFNFTETLEFQGWNAFYERLTGPVYPVLVKKFWVHVVAEKDTITSYIMNRKTVSIEKLIAYLISHNGCGKRVYNVKYDAHKDSKLESVIFKEGTKFDDGKGPSAKDLIDNLRVWFKIILGCLHHRQNTKSFDYTNTAQKIMLFFLKKGFKPALPAICLSYSWIQ